MLSETKSRFAGKTSFFISIVFIGLIAAGCSTTTYLNLKEDNRGIIERQLDNAEKGKDVGVEVTIILMDETKINGELLSVLDSSLIICTEHSTTEEELSNSTYPIILVKNNEIQELTIEGSSYVWTGIAVGVLTGIVTGGLIVKAGSDEAAAEFAGVAIGFYLGLAAGWITGYALSTEEFILQEIPSGYDFYFLKSLARYQDKEPDYLKVIK